MKATILPVAAFLVVAGLAFAFGYCVWPTRYEYHTVRKPFYVVGSGTHYDEVWRVDRFSGDAEKVIDGKPVQRSP